MLLFIMKIVCLGPKESFTEKATLKAFPNSEIVVLPTIRQVIESVESEKYVLGVVPLENFYNGMVMQTIDALMECNKTMIIDEIYLGIEHCVGALKNSKEINKVLSHPQALEQCAKYISEIYPSAEMVTVESTAKAAETIKNNDMIKLKNLNTGDLTFLFMQ